METQQQELPYQILWLKQIPIWLFGISFLGGTILLATYLMNPKSENYISIGLSYLILSFLVNSIVFIGLAIASFIYKQYQTIILARATLLLVNVPVAIIYFFIVIYSKQLNF